MTLEMDVREMLDQHVFDGYDEEQVWARCTCGETYLDTHAHQAEVVARWSLDKVRAEMIAEGWLPRDEKMRMVSAQVARLSEYSRKLEDIRIRVMFAESELGKTKSDMDRIAGACRRALGQSWEGREWAEGVRAIELVARTGFAGGLESCWKRIKKTVTPGNKDQPWVKGDPWKHRGKR